MFDDQERLQLGRCRENPTACEGLEIGRQDHVDRQPSPPPVIVRSTRLVRLGHFRILDAIHQHGHEVRVERLGILAAERTHSRACAGTSLRGRRIRRRRRAAVLLLRPREAAFPHALPPHGLQRVREVSGAAPERARGLKRGQRQTRTRRRRSIGEEQAPVPAPCCEAQSPRVARGVSSCTFARACTTQYDSRARARFAPRRRMRFRGRRRAISISSPSRKSGSSETALAGRREAGPAQQRSRRERVRARHGQADRGPGRPPFNQLPWEFHVVQDDAINAFAIPGGHVYVHTGLIKTPTTHRSWPG